MAGFNRIAINITIEIIGIAIRFTFLFQIFIAWKVIYLNLKKLYTCNSRLSNKLLVKQWYYQQVLLYIQSFLIRHWKLDLDESWTVPKLINIPRITIPLSRKNSTIFVLHVFSSFTWLVVAWSVVTWSGESTGPTWFAVISRVLAKILTNADFDEILP